MTDIQIAAKDAIAVSPYVWEIAAFFGVLGVLRITQAIKKIRWLPLWLCNLKQSKDRKHLYRKLKKKYLIGFASLGSFGIITLCLFQKYPDMQQVMIISGIIAVSQFAIIETIFQILDAWKPGISETLSNGLYIPEEDQTVFTKTGQFILGGGTDKRRK